MPTAAARASSPRYQSLFLDLAPARPLRFFFLEQLLEARRDSQFPTSAAGNDEDVNVYLARLLESHVWRRDDPRPNMAGPLLLTPPSRATSRGGRAGIYRAHADARLIHLGLFGHGDGQRRRTIPYGFTPREARERDLQDMRTCYGCAASLLGRTAGSAAGLVPVLEKLARHGEEYVHVLQVLARRRLGLGARLDADGLADLFGGQPDEAPVDAATATEVASVLRPRADGPTMDVILDLVLELRRRPATDLQKRLINLAQPLALDIDRLLAAAAEE